MAPASGTFDVGIVGGGPAGLSAALVLSRARLRVALFDAGPPRNERSPAVGGLLSRDGTTPAVLRDIALEQIARYGMVELFGERVLDVRGGSGALRIQTSDGAAAHCERVALTVGVVDHPPPIPGLAELWGRSVIHCGFCSGWENAGRRWGVLATHPEHLEQARTYLSWTDDVQVFASPELHVTAGQARALRVAGIAVRRGVIARLESSPARELEAVVLQGGERVPCGTLVVKPAQRQTGLVQALGLELDAGGRVAVDDRGETSRPGVFAAGDLVVGPQSVIAAAGAGSVLAMHLVNTRGHAPQLRRAPVAATG